MFGVRIFPPFIIYKFFLIKAFLNKWNIKLNCYFFNVFKIAFSKYKHSLMVYLKIFE